MLLGHSVNVSRYDQQKYEVFEKLIEKQISYFGRPEENATQEIEIDSYLTGQIDATILASDLEEMEI